MDLFAQLSSLEVHDSILKSLTLGFNSSYVAMEIDFFEEQTGEYVTNRLNFTGVSRINMVNLDVSAGDIEIFSLEIQQGDLNGKRIIFQFLQGPGKPSATLEFVCKEAELTEEKPA
jgi:hypothetical protein